MKTTFGESELHDMIDLFRSSRDSIENREKLNDAPYDLS